MKKFSAVFLALLLTSLITVIHADGETASNHHHCICGAANCSEGHGETGGFDWQAWNGDITVGSASDASSGAVYLYLEKDITITNTLDIKDVTVYLCLNGKTLTINKEGHPAVRVGENQNFILCDCKETGKITGAKGNTNDELTRRGTINCQTGSSFVMYGGSIADNEIIGANGGGVFVSGGTFTMHGGSFRNNKAPNGSGGAVSAENGRIYIYGGEMTENRAINGGAIHLKNKTTAEIKNLKASDNTARGMGGAIFTETSDNVNIYNAEISGNNAANGGGIYVKAIKNNNSNPFFFIKIYNSDIHDNHAKNHGGGILLDGSNKNNATTSLYDSNIHDNHAGSDGGGLYLKASAAANLYGDTFAGNSCSGNGGAICATGSTYLYIPKHNNPTYIRGNTANSGGGIYTNANQFNSLGTCVFEGNTAQNNGGAIYISGTHEALNLVDATITKNIAKLGGGVFLNGEHLGFNGNTSIMGNTSSVDGSANNLYLNNNKMFFFYNKVGGDTKIGVSVSEPHVFEEPLGIETAFREEWYAYGDHSNLIISDNDDYEIIYEETKYDEDGKKVKDQRHCLVPKPSLTLTEDEVSAIYFGKPAVLLVASYNKKGLLDIKKFNIEKSTAMTVVKTGLNTKGATKLSAYLWDSIDNMIPVAKSVETKFSSISLQTDTQGFEAQSNGIKCKVVVAGYNGDMLVSSKTIVLDETNNYGCKKTYAEIGLNTENLTKIKFFVWDDDMIPLCEGEEIGIYPAPSTD